MIIGAGFAVSQETGMVLALGLSVELLFLGLAMVSDTMKGWRVLLLSVLLAVDVLAFSLLGNYFLAGAGHIAISAILAFGVAALLYLVTDELLIEAHTVAEKPSTLWLFAGFFDFLVDSIVQCLIRKTEYKTQGAHWIEPFLMCLASCCNAQEF